MNQVDIYNTPVSPYNDVKYVAGWFSDTWKMNNRLSVNYGGRLEHYTDGWPDQTVAPNGIPALAGWNDPTYQAFIAPKNVTAKIGGHEHDVRAARGFRVRPDGRQPHGAQGLRRPVPLQLGRHRRRPAEPRRQGAAALSLQRPERQPPRSTARRSSGALVQTVGGAGFVTVDPNLIRPSSTEFSTSVEREIRQGLSGRVSYVYKNIRNEWNEVDTARVGLYTVPFNFVDIGNDGVSGTADDKTVALLDWPATAPSNRMWTNPSNGHSDFSTVEVAVNRRFAGKWMMLTSFGYTWLNQINSMVSSTSNTGVAGNLRAYYYRPSQLMFGDQGYEGTTTWNYKIIGRYVMPYDIGFSGSWKVQSGYQWGRVTSVNFPGDGAQNIRMEPVTANRAPNVGIMDARLDKAFRFGKFGKLTAQVDMFNLLNSGTVTVFRTTTGTTFKEVLGILDPRIVRFGLRFDF